MDVKVTDESVVIDCGRGLKLVVREAPIGPVYYVHAESNGRKRGKFYAFFDDYGEFCTGFEAQNEPV